MKISKKNKVALALSLLLFTACGSAKTDVVKTENVKTEAVKTQAAVDTQPKTDASLKPFISEEGNFSIVFGGEPKVSSKPSDLGGGISVIMNTFLYVSGPTSVEGLAYTDMASKKMSETEIRDLLKKEESGVLESYNITKADEEKESDYKTYPGLFYKAKTSDGVYVVAQTYYVNDRLFQMQISGANSYPTDAEVASFIGSFKLLK